MRPHWFGALGHPGRPHCGQDTPGEERRVPADSGDPGRGPDTGHIPQGDREGLSPFWMHLMDKPLNLALEREPESPVLVGEGLTGSGGGRAAGSLDSTSSGGKQNGLRCSAPTRRVE